MLLLALVVIESILVFLNLSKSLFARLKLLAKLVNRLLLVILLTNTRPELSTWLSKRQEQWVTRSISMELIDTFKDFLFFTVLLIEV